MKTTSTCITETLQDHTLQTSEEVWRLFDNLQSKLKFTYLLSHHDDGIIWGYFGESWKLSEKKVNSPVFNPVTLQQCRLFGPQAEFFLWRSGSGFKSRLLVEYPGEDFEIIDKRHILWGTEAEPQNDNFTLMREGQQGMLHLLPIPNPKLHVALNIRAYIDYDHDNHAFFRWHRLTGIETNIQPKDYRFEERDGTTLLPSL